MKKKNNIASNIKLIVFLVVVLLIARVAIFIIGNGSINSLEGYLYSLAASATSSNATCSNATSSNATSSNATSSNATSSNATSSNAARTTTTTTQTTTTQTTTNQTTTKLSTTKQNTVTEIVNDIDEEKNVVTSNIIETTEETMVVGQQEQLENSDVKIVSFLESHKTYVMLIGICVLAIVLVSIIIVIDKKATAKRKMKASQENNNEENK